MARPTQDPQIRINEILDTAEPLFYANGYHETAISDIAKKMGVAQGTIYYYFTSKEELLETLIKRDLAVSISKVYIAVRNSCSPFSISYKLQIAIQALLDSLYRGEGDGLTFEFLHNDQTIHFLDKLARQGKQLLNPLLLELIEEGYQQQCFRITNPQAALNVIVSLIEALIDAIYERVPAEVLQCQVELTEKLIKTTLRAEDGCIKLAVKH